MIKFIMSLLVLTSVIAIVAFWGGFTVHFSIELARAGWQLVELIF
jgi:hypothetical protein